MTLVADARSALLDGLFDYAGLFPPASLDLPAAMAAYRTHAADPAGRLLRRFVVPAARLPELSPWLAGAGDGPDLRLTVLAAAADGPAVRRFLQDHPAAVLEAVEARLASPALAEIDRLLETFPDVDLCVEMASPAAGHDDDPDRAFVAALAGRAPWVGYKLRCGGGSPAQIPSVARVARVAASCRDARVFLKLTAGLHHPVRGMGHTGEATMHGFLNVVGASLLAWTHGLAAGQLAEVVAETDPAAFRLDPDGFGWRTLAVDAGRIASGRRDAVRGIGSCSFLEPRDDLRALGMLPWTT